MDCAKDVPQSATNRRKSANAVTRVVTLMKYQLIVQWPAYSVKDYDEMICFEEALINHMGGLALLDGHDAGSGEMNIFADG
jgi:hypothetical protein